MSSYGEMKMAAKKKEVVKKKNAGGGGNGQPTKHKIPVKAKKKK